MMVKIFSDADDLALNLSIELTCILRKKSTCIALSGGSTPDMVYRYLSVSNATEYKSHLFWGDERMVPGDDQQSNYGHANRLFLGPCKYPQGLIHAVNTALPAQKAAQNYAQQIRAVVPPGGNQLPQFDWILLGLGTDGHTASLFPGMELQSEPNGFCALSSHPQSGQKRITFTRQLINAAKRITFLVTGAAKQDILKRVLKDKDQSLPAATILAVNGKTEWYVDESASNKL